MLTDTHIYQQIVFYRDILRFYLKYGRHYRADMDAWAKEPHAPIPKTIHYCWFGRGPYGEKEQRCMESWKKYLPDWDFKLWNEDNFPYEQYPFAKQALHDRKWAFVSDVARLHALYEEGGIYMDTDVEVLKDLTPVLQHGFFTGRESECYVGTGTMASVRHHPFSHLLLQWYRGYTYGKAYYTITNARIITRIVRLCCGVEKGIDQVDFDDCRIYAEECFCPNLVHGKWAVMPETYCIHHFTKSWE